METKLLEIRAKVYNFLAINLYDSPEVIIDKFPDNYNFSRDVFHFFSLPNQKVKIDELTREYEQLFVGPGPIAAPPWESAYIKNDKTLFNEHTLKLREEYFEFKLLTKDLDKRPDDHIALQLAFLGELNQLLLRKDSTEKEIESLLQRQLQFLIEHPLKWLPYFKREVESSKPNSCYAKLLDWFCQFLEEEQRLLQAELESSVEITKTDHKQNFYNKLVKLNWERLNYRQFFVYNPDYEFVKEKVPSTGTNNCGGRCLFEVITKAGVITDLSSNEACVRGGFYRQTYLNYDRLKYPMKRVGPRGEGKFKRISWAEAVETIASELTRVKKEYGPGARYVNYAWGVNALIQPMKLAKRLLALDGGFLDYYNSYSTACTAYATPYTYGTAETGNSPSDWVNSELIILWGHNPVATIFGTTVKHLRKAKEAGAEIIVVDPRYSDTVAHLADEWIPLRPTTDNALFSAMAYVIISEELYDKDFVDKYTIGFSEKQMPEGVAEADQSYRAYIMGDKDGVAKTPAWAAEITGLSQERIVTLAREYATADAAALIQGWGPQRHQQGEQTVRAATVLAAITANVGNSGGWASGAGYLNRQKISGIPKLLNPYPAKIPSFLWTEAVNRGKELTEDDGLKGAESLASDIKLIINLAGNCLINQHADSNKTAQLLKDEDKVEFIVVSDIFLTASAKFADILLPGDTFLERDNIAKPWGYGNYLIHPNRAVKPPFECRNEYDWLTEVAEELGIKEEFTMGHETVSQWCRWIVNQIKNEHPEFPDYQKFKTDGIYRWNYENPKIAFKEQISDFANNPFPTPSGKIEIFSKRLYDLDNKRIPPIPEYIKVAEGAEDDLRAKYPLQCIAWHSKRRCHSIYDNSPWAEKVEKHRVWINTTDAKKRGIKDGDRVQVFNKRGRLEIEAEVTERVGPGVVAIPQGGWWKPDKDGIDKRGNINVLTSQKPTPLAKGNSQHTMLVEVNKK